MKTTKLVIPIVMIAVALFLILPNLSWAADDGATIYKTKCAACHGVDLGGKPAAKIPSLVSDDAKKASDADLTEMIANGGKDKKASHTFANKGVTPDQVKMVMTCLREGAEEVGQQLSRIAVPRRDVRAVQPGSSDTRESE